MTFRFQPDWLPNGIQTLDGEDLLLLVSDAPYSDSVVTADDIASTEVADRVTCVGATLREETGWQLGLDDLGDTTLTADGLSYYLVRDAATDADRLIVGGDDQLIPTGLWEPSFDDGALFLPFASRTQGETLTTTAPIVKTGTVLSLAIGDGLDVVDDELVATGGGGGGDLPGQTGNDGKILRTDGTDPSWTDLGIVIADATAKTTPVGGDKFVMSDSDDSDVAKRISFDDLAAAIGGGGDVAGETHAATGKTTPVDADELPLVDSAASNVLKKLTWANLKATLKTYFDTLYPSGSGTSTGTNTGDQTLPTLSSLGAVPTSRTLAGLDLSADRTASALRTALGLVIGTDVLAPNGSGASLTGIPESAVTNLVTDLAAKAPLASPALTGSPTAPTQTAGDNSTKVATTAYVDGRGKYRTVLSAGGTGSTIAGVPGGSIINNLAYTNNIYPSNFLIYEWFICPYDLDITALYARTITGGASSNTRIGLVEGTKSFQPAGSMLTESSSVATTANETLVTHTPGSPIRLTAGRVYATTIQFNGTAPTWYCLLNTNGPAHQGGWSWAFGPDRAIYALRVSRSYAAVSGTPPAWDTVSNTSNLVWNRSVLMTWTEA